MASTINVRDVGAWPVRDPQLAAVLHLQMKRNTAYMYQMQRRSTRRAVSCVCVHGNTKQQ